MLKKSFFSFRWFLSLAVLFFYFPSNLFAGSFGISDNFIEISSQKFRRAGSTEVSMLAIGVKKNPIGKVPYFEHSFDWRDGNINIKQGKTITITQDDLTQLGVTVSGTYNGIYVNGNANNSHRNDSEYVLTNFTLVSDIDVRNELNRNKNTLRDIKSLGHHDKARIITSVWVVIRGNESQVSSFDGKIFGARFDVNGQLSLSNSNNVQVTFSPNSIIAYEFKEFDWNRKGIDQHRETIKRLKADDVWR